METRWTPGPWEVSDFGGKLSIKKVKDSRVIAVVDARGPIEDAANARLAAAAPEMYELLKEARGTTLVALGVTTKGKHYELSRRLNTIEAMLLRVEGEQYDCAHGVFFAGCKCCEQASRHIENRVAGGNAR